MDELRKRLEVSSTPHVYVDNRSQPIVAVDVASIELADEVSPGRCDGLQFL